MRATGGDGDDVVFLLAATAASIGGAALAWGSTLSPWPFVSGAIFGAVSLVYLLVNDKVLRQHATPPAARPTGVPRGEGQVFFAAPESLVQLLADMPERWDRDLLDVLYAQPVPRHYWSAQRAAARREAFVHAAVYLADRDPALFRRALDPDAKDVLDNVVRTALAHRAATAKATR